MWSTYFGVEKTNYSIMAVSHSLDIPDQPVLQIHCADPRENAGDMAI